MNSIPVFLQSVRRVRGEVVSKDSNIFNGWKSFVFFSAINSRTFRFMISIPVFQP